MKTRAIIATASLLCLAGVISAQQGTAAAPKPSVMDIKGKPFPEIKMKTLDDKEFSNKNFKDKVTIVDFWATWCGPCVAAAPKLQTMHEDLGKRGLQIVGANAFERDGNGGVDNSSANAKKYVEEHKYTYTFTYGNSELAQKLNITGIPTFMVIDKKGVVRDVFVGFKEKELRAAVEALL